MSPIRDYLDLVLGSLLTIAPENEQYLIDIINKYQITPTWDDSNKFIFSANPQTKKIRFSIPALEYLWASAYTYWVTYQEAYLSTINGINQIKISEIPRLKKATDLLLWAKKNISGDQHYTWPLGLPKPNRSNNSASDEHVATELFLCSTAWILHHEIAHIYQQHSSLTETPNAIMEEKEADEKATVWILKNISDNKIIKKRVMGIVVANLAIFCLSLENKNFSYLSHPKSYERIFNNLELAKLDKNHVAYFFTIVNMKLHLDYCNINVDNDLLFNNAKECLQIYCISLSKLF